LFHAYELSQSKTDLYNLLVTFDLKSRFNTDITYGSNSGHPLEIKSIASLPLVSGFFILVPTLTIPICFSPTLYRSDHGCRLHQHKQHQMWMQIWFLLPARRAVWSVQEMHQVSSSFFGMCSSQSRQI